MWPAFRHVLRTYAIDPADLHAMLDGQRCDLVKTRYETFEELYDYCYKVASVVGLVCIRIWGAPATLFVYVTMGWLIGMQRMRTVLMLTVLQNALSALERRD